MVVFLPSGHGSSTRWFIGFHCINHISINNMDARLNFSDKIVCSFHLWKMNKWWKRISHERKINTICQQTYKTAIQIELIVLSIYPLLLYTFTVYIFSLHMFHERKLINWYLTGNKCSFKLEPFHCKTVDTLCTLVKL